MSVAPRSVSVHGFLDPMSRAVSLLKLRSYTTQVVNLCASAHEIWSLPLQILVALGLMWTQVCGTRA